MPGILVQAEAMAATHVGLSKEAMSPRIPLAQQTQGLLRGSQQRPNTHCYNNPMKIILLLNVCFALPAL
jgi:hypothetical protein